MYRGFECSLIISVLFLNSLLIRITQFKELKVNFQLDTQISGNELLPGANRFKITS